MGSTRWSASLPLHHTQATPVVVAVAVLLLLLRLLLLLLLLLEEKHLQGVQRKLLLEQGPRKTGLLPQAQILLLQKQSVGERRWELVQAVER